jgi:hypothetical protein
VELNYEKLGPDTSGLAITLGGGGLLAGISRVASEVKKFSFVSIFLSLHTFQQEKRYYHGEHRINSNL